MANKRQRKKRMKKLAQMKLIEVTPIVKPEIVQDQDKSWLNPVIIDSGKEPPKRELFLGKYEKHNHKYQLLLDKKYAGNVQPIERFINFHSSILHTCENCNSQWYSRPDWLLIKENQLHKCGVTAKVKPNGKRKVNDDDIVRMSVMAEQGISSTNIAKHFDISRTTVNKYLQRVRQK